MKKLTFGIFIFMATLSQSGCISAPVAMVESDPAKIAYLDAIKAQAWEFNLPKSESEPAWGRAQNFISKYSSMRIQVATDYVIETYDPSNGNVAFGYGVTRMMEGDSVAFTVRVSSGNMFAGAYRTMNGDILSYYIATGQLPYPEMIMR